MKTITTALLIVFLAGCKKTDNITNVIKPLELQGEFNNVLNATLGTVKMYTKNSITFDSTVIKNFLKRVLTNQLASYTFSTDSETFSDSLLNVSFADSGKVNVQYNLTAYLHDKYDGKILSKSDSEIIIQGLKKDTVLYLIPIFSIDSNLPEINTGKYNLSASCTNLSPATGYLKYCIYQSHLPLQIINNELYLPMITYTIRRKNTTNNSVYGYYDMSEGAKNTFNILNPTLQNQLFEGDTVVLQTKQIKLQIK